MFLRFRPAITALFALILLTPAFAQDLKVGDPAPELYVSQWLNGEAIEEFEAGKVYVVENWATWCGPCITAIPHLNELYQEHKDEGLVVIGLNVWDDDAKAVKFVEQQGEKMSYPIAIDDRPSGRQSGKSAMAWLEAAGRNGIPAAFVVDQKGTIAWIGHPMAGMDGVVKKVLAGDYDPEAEAAKQAKIMPLQQKLQGALQQQHWDVAVATIDELSEAMGDDPMASRLAAFKVSILLAGKGDYDTGYAAMKQAVEGPIKDDPDALNDLAWLVATEPTIQQRNLELAGQAAARAVELSEGKNAAFLDTLARVRFDQGNAAEAVTLQEKAVAQSADLPPEAITEMKAALETYRKAAETAAGKAG